MKDRKKAKERFVGIPHWVMHHPAFRAASHRARALLLDVVLQYNGSNNGKLVVCGKALKPLGWNSNDALYKAKNELLTLGLLTETRCGAKPSKAAWYALSWRKLDIVDGLDINPRSYVMLGARKIESGPPHGGAVEGTFGPLSTPPHGAYIDCHTKCLTEGGEDG